MKKSVVFDNKEVTSESIRSYSDESVFAVSDSQLFPTSSDSIWKSATIIRRQENPIGTPQYNVAPMEQDDRNVSQTFSSQSWTKEDKCQQNRNSTVDQDKLVDNRNSLLKKETTENTVLSGLNESFQNSTVNCSPDAEAKSKIELGETDSRMLCKLPSSIAADVNYLVHHKNNFKEVHHMNPPDEVASADEVKDKMNSCLRFLYQLTQSSSCHGKDLKHIYEAYYSYSQAIFDDLKVSDNQNKENISDYDDNIEMTWTILKQDLNEIDKQEELLEKEIIHYKKTKGQIHRVADAIEETSKAYKRSDVLDDVVIPTDVKLSSSSEYVSEIRELQEEILKKQEQVHELHKEIQEGYLPKGLVDSICESHRMSIQTLKDIVDETTYLKDCVKRLDIKYLYNLQIS